LALPPKLLFQLLYFPAGRCNERRIVFPQLLLGVAFLCYRRKIARDGIRPLMLLLE
jgi:hypothetical protein